MKLNPMSVLDLIKATVMCGGVAFLFYSYPILGQILMIALLSLLWLSYARKTVLTLRRKLLA
jgi:energy-converting hydrogenase Eha subunit C